MVKKEDFYKSQERFSKWRNTKYDCCTCMFQVYDLKNGILLEKWKLRPMTGKPEFKMCIVEFYTDGGSLDCSNIKLTSLQGLPPTKADGGSLDCSNIKLTSLKGSPIKAGFSIYELI